MSAPLDKRVVWISAAVFAASFLVRLIASHVVSPELPHGDDRLYMAQAQALLAPAGEMTPLVNNQGELVLLPPRQLFPGLAPGYPWFLAGLRTIGLDGVLEVRIVQALLGALTGLLVFALGRRVFGHWPGLLAALAFAVYPAAVYLCVVIYPQCVLSFLLCLALWLCLRATDTASWGLAAACGLVFGIAGLCVPPVLPCVLVAGAWLVLAGTGSRARRASVAGALALGVAAGLAPSRLPGMGGTLSSPMATFARTVHQKNQPGLTAFSAAHSPSQTSSQPQVTPEGAATDPQGGRDAQGASPAVFFARDPVGFVKLTADKLWAFYRPYPVTRVKTRLTTGPYRMLGILSSGPALLLGWLGAILGWQRSRDSRLLTMSIVVYTATYTAMFTNQRYRLPVDPLFIVLAAYTVYAAWERITHRRHEAHGAGALRTSPGGAKRGLFSFLRAQHHSVSTALAGTPAFHRVSAGRYALWQTLSAVGHGRLAGRVLDAGAGNNPYRGAFDDGIESYTAVDIVPANGQTHCVADVTALPMRGEAFDSVLCSQVLEHVPDPSTALEEFARVLVPGGAMVLTVPHLSRLHEEPHDYYRYTHYGLSHLLTRAGFETLSVRAAGGLLCFAQTQVATMILAALWPLSVLRPAWIRLSTSLAKACVWLDSKTGTERLFPLNYVALARKRGALPSEHRGDHARPVARPPEAGELETHPSATRRGASE